MTLLIAPPIIGQLLRLTLVTLLLSACHNVDEDISVAPNDSNESGAAALLIRDIRPAIKRVIAEALAGNYNEACQDYSRATPQVAAEQSIVLTKDGIVNSGIGDFDLVRERNVEAMLSIDAASVRMAADISIRDETGKKRLYTLAIQHTAAQTNAKLQNAWYQPMRAIACQGAAPAALTFDVWTPVVNQMADVATTLQCRNTDATTSHLRLQIAHGEVRINDTIFTADNALQPQSISSNNAGVVFSFRSKKAIRYELHFKADAQLSALHVSQDNVRQICQ